jgi:hypothetical protein
VAIDHITQADQLAAVIDHVQATPRDRLRPAQTGDQEMDAVAADVDCGAYRSRLPGFG